MTGTLPGLEAAADRPEPAATGYLIEEELIAAGAARPGRIAGVDEVGRGAWAGPVLVCAAVTDLGPPPVLPDGRVGLTDSKLLTRARREAFAGLLPGWLRGHAIGAATPQEIDDLGMTEALRRAAVRALRALAEQPDVVLLDGGHDFLGAPWKVRCEVKADQRSVSVAAASVLAKVTRDRLMADLDAAHPGFGFADSAGYPSPEHQRALEEHGPTPHHRMSWSYLDRLPRWRHLRRYRDPLAGEGQLSLL